MWIPCWISESCHQSCFNFTFGLPLWAYAKCKHVVVWSRGGCVSCIVRWSCIHVWWTMVISGAVDFPNCIHGLNVLVGLYQPTDAA